MKKKICLLSGCAALAIGAVVLCAIVSASRDKQLSVEADLSDACHEHCGCCGHDHAHNHEPEDSSNHAHTSLRLRFPVQRHVDGAIANERPTTPDDIAAFNAAVDAGEAVEVAAEKCFSKSVNTDGILAALKVMSQAKDAKTRGGAYKAVGRLFTDADDLASAVATAQRLFSAMPTSVGGGDHECENHDACEGDCASEECIVDDSEADAAEQTEEEVEIPITAEVEPMCDGVQGDAIAKLLKDGVADADASVRQEALSAASQMEDHFQYGTYEEVLKGSDSALKKNVLELCSTFGREEDVAIQKQALNDADADVAATAQKNLDSEEAKSFMEADAAAKAAEPNGGQNE